MDFKKSVKGFVKKLDRTEVIGVFLIFVLALAIRSHLMIYELFFEFDTYFHARMGAYVIQNLALPTTDWLAYYQLQNAALPAQGAFFWAFTAAIYKVFTLGAAYNKELWIVFVKVLPALFGALTVSAIYFFGKEMYDKKTGLVMAFFAAVVPAYVYRTMAGQFEEDSLGFLWMVIGFLFLVKALKQPSFDKKSVGLALVSGIFFGIMAWTWEMFMLVPMILIGYVVTSLVLFWFRNEKKAQIFNFLKICAITFLVFSLLAVIFTGTGWIQRSIDYVTQYAPVSAENIERASQKGEGVLAATVGEENLGLPFWFDKYNALIIFPILAVVLLPLKILKRNDRFGLILFIWLGITAFMAFNKLKFTYTFGIPLAFAAGIVFSELLIFVKDRSPFEKKTVMISFAFLCLVGVGAASIFVTTKVPTIEQDNGWKEALSWIKNNTAEDARFFNWWDNGHHLTFMGERKASVDNRNLDLQADTDYGLFILSSSEEEAYNLLDRYDADYVIIDNGVLTQMTSMGMYAYNTTNVSDPRIIKYFGVVFNCNRNFDQLTQVSTFACGPNTLSESQIGSMPVSWISTPNQLLERTVPGFVYSTPSKNFLFLFNEASNNSFGARLWFNDPLITKFEQVYFGNGIKVFKVVK